LNCPRFLFRIQGRTSYTPKGKYIFERLSMMQDKLFIRNVKQIFHLTAEVNKYFWTPVEYGEIATGA
jgi:hypothetical protein